MKKNHIKWVKPNTLVPNEEAVKTFGTKPTNYESIRESIMQVGILEPLIVIGKKIISGNLRHKIAIELKLELIPIQETLKPIENLETATFHHAQQRIKTPQELLKEARLLKSQFPVGQGCRTDLNSDKKKNKDKQDGKGISKAKYYKLETIDKNARELYGEGSIEYRKIWDDINSGHKSINAAASFLERIIGIKKNALVISEKEEKHTDKYSLYNKSCQEMSELEDKSIACIFCSPPYYEMRDYGTGENQRGQEKDIQTFINGVVKDMSDCMRVLKDDGSLWVNMGECIIDDEYHLVPSRIAMALKKEGWKLNDEWIWVKHNPPFNHSKKAVRSHEYIFHFVKSKNYYYDNSLLYNLIDPQNASTYGNKVRSLISAMDVRGNVVKTNSNNMEDVRKECKKEGFTLTHSAGFPVTIPLLGILATSKVGDTILDIYSGTASTGEAAIKAGRKYVGYELKSEFVKGAKVRMMMAEEEIKNIKTAA